MKENRKIPIEDKIEIPSELSITKIGELIEKFPECIPIYDYKKKAFILKLSKIDKT